MTATPRPVPLGVKVGFTLLMAGLGAWLWLGDWRWAATGALALLAGAVIGAKGTAPPPFAEDGPEGQAPS